MNRLLTALLVAATLSLSGAAGASSIEMRRHAPAKEQEVYKGWTCRDVRLFVQQEGKIKALAIAVSAGATTSEIQKARACVNGRKS